MHIPTVPMTCILVFAAHASAQSTTRVSVSSSGEQGNSYSSSAAVPSISSDGRLVAFQSNASNLVAGDTNGVEDAFVHDRVTGQTTRVNLTPAGAQVAASAARPFISANGRFVVFDSGSEQIVPGDTNNQQDVFVYDRVTGVSTLDSLTSTGAQANNGCAYASISSDGRFVAFQSSATNLVPGDTNGQSDIFVRDRLLGVTTRVSVSSAGVQANNITDAPMISANGRFIAFASAASNLVTGDTNATWDIFVHDRLTAETSRVSVNSAGVEGNSASLDRASISEDGRFVAFHSIASNLVAGDTNFEWDIFVHDRLTGATTRESVSSAGSQVSSGSFAPSVSANGRYVSYLSFAFNLVPNDTNGKQDIFVRDRLNGVTTRESISTAGDQADQGSDVPVISGDGRITIFVSSASNLVAGDTNATFDVFARDLGHVITGDLNGDGVVNGSDLALLLGQWGACPGCPSDLNGDGVVNGADLGLLLGNWT